ncbi:MAG: hypothetical protein ACXVKI_13625 [Flavisolibacter sp.]
MKMYHLYVALLATLLSTTALAQTRSAAQTNTTAHTTKAPAEKPAQKTLSQQTDSLKMAMKDMKTSFNSLFGAKRDTIAIAISNIEYDDAGLNLLKENLKKLKGVKSVMMQYKATSALLEVSFKGKASELWDKLPAEARAPFKILEAGEGTLTLENRSAKEAVLHQ